METKLSVCIYIQNTVNHLLFVSVLFSKKIILHIPAYMYMNKTCVLHIKSDIDMGLSQI